MENQTFELIIRTESKVLTCNIADFEQQTEQFLSTLTQTFETDSDFAQAKEEVKRLKELEDKTRTAIKNIQQGDINKLIERAEIIANRFRDERLAREKRVKSKETEIKQNIIKTAFDTVMKARIGFESNVSLALERNISKQDIQHRLEEATKRRSTLATLTKAVNTEACLLIEEMAQEASRIAQRRKQIPIQYEHLFKDSITLIASTEELEPIIQERIAAEQQREAEIKAKIVQEAKERTVTQTTTQETAPTATQFILKIPAQEIPFTGTLEQLREYFAPVKALGITATITKQ